MGLGLVAGFSVLMGANLFFFQGPGKSTKRIVFPDSATVHTLTPNDVAATPAFDAAEAWGKAAVITPQPVAAPAAVMTGSVLEPDLVRAVQRELNGIGYEAGTIDGVAGLTTRAAVLAYEWDQGLPLTAEPSQQTLRGLLLGGAAPRGAVEPSNAEPGPRAVEVYKTAAYALTQLGYGNFKTTTGPSAELQRAIRKFEVKEGLQESGRVSAPLMARLTRISTDKRLASRR